MVFVLTFPQTHIETRIWGQVVSLGGGPGVVLGRNQGNEPGLGEKISLTVRIDESVNVTVSDEEFEIILQLLPSLVNGCPGAFTSWYLQSVLFLPCVVRGCPQRRRRCRKPWWCVEGDTWKWLLGGWRVWDDAWVRLLDFFWLGIVAVIWNDFLKKDQVLLVLWILF